MKLNLAILVLAIAAVIVWSIYFTQESAKLKEDFQSLNQPETAQTEPGYKYQDKDYQPAFGEVQKARSL